MNTDDDIVNQFDSIWNEYLKSRDSERLLKWLRCLAKIDGSHCILFLRKVFNRAPELQSKVVDLAQTEFNMQNIDFESDDTEVL